MIRLKKPTRDQIDAFLEAKKLEPFNYSDQGATQGTIPNGYHVNHARLLLGQGEETFAIARQALEQWQQFNLSWAQICWPGAPLQSGELVAVLAHVLGFWTLTPCRIVYQIEEQHRYGFAYGSVEGHFLRGEERFLLEHDPGNGSVTFDILAFSRPSGWLARLGSWYVLRLQKRFSRESPQALLRAVEEQKESRSLSQSKETVLELPG